MFLEPTTKEYFFRQRAPLSQRKEKKGEKKKKKPRFIVHFFIRTKKPPLKILKEILYIYEYFEKTLYGSLSERQ